MAVVDLHPRDTSLPSQFLSDEDDDIILPQSQEHNPSNNSSSSSSNNNNEFGSSHINPLVGSGEAERNDKDDDFIAELTHQMAQSTLQEDCEFDFSGIFSQTLELSWDLMGSPQSTLWSSLGSNRGSSEGSSQEPSPPATPAGNSRNSQPFCWKMKLDEGGNSKYHHPSAGNEIQSLKTSKSNIGRCSYQSLIQEQIRAIQLSRLKQEQVLSLKQKLSEASQGQKSHSQQSKSEPKEQTHKFQKKGKRGSGGVANDGRRTRCSLRSAPLQSQQQAGSGMRALFLGGSGSRSGTGVFLPRGGGTGANTPAEPRKKPGKGCSTVLIPARVVQALQLHFDQMAATSGPKAGGFPPLHDGLASSRDGMDSMQKRRSRKAAADIQKEMILPQEWTY